MFSKITSKCFTNISFHKTNGIFGLIHKFLTDLTCRTNEAMGGSRFKLNIRQEGLRGKMLTAILLFTFLILQQANGTWYTQNTEVFVDLWGVTFININTGWIVGDYGIIRKTTDGGETWMDQSSGTTEILRKIIMIDEYTGYISGHSGVILKTTDSGQNWFDVGDSYYGRSGGELSYYGGMDNFGSDFVFIAGENLTYAKTVNGGLNWEYGIITGVLGEFDIYGVDVINTNLIYITGSFHGASVTPKIYKTTNGGMSWNLVYNSPDFGAGMNDIKFINQNTGFACSSSGSIVQTTNGGTNWSYQGTGGFDLRQFQFISTNTGFTCGGSGNITYTTNGGTNWTTVNSGVTGSSLLSMSFVDSLYGWASGSGGTLIKTTDGAGTIIFEKAECLNFDGVDDNISLPSGLPQNLTSPTVSEITIEYWFKGSNLQSAVRIQNGGNYIVAGWGSPGNHTHIISTEGGTNGINVGAAATDGNWHHVAMTWKKNTVNGFKSYLDGALVQQRNSANSNLPAVSSEALLGSYQGTSEFLSGTLDEVRIWTRALTQSDIAANMPLEISSGTGLLASYHFNQGLASGNNPSVTTLKDTTSNNYSGTLANFALYAHTSNWISPGPNLRVPSGTINIKVIVEGYYNSSSNVQNISDTMNAYLCADVSPYNVIDSAKKVIDSVTHTGVFKFDNAASGNYYIKLNHRNSIETWSSSPQSLLDTSTFDFTSSQSQAFGDNMKQVDASPVIFAIYSGDVNQDGVVDGTDAALVDNDAFNFVTGYVVTDVNGDEVVDGSDAAIVDNNAFNFVGKITP